MSLPAATRVHDGELTKKIHVNITATTVLGGGKTLENEHN